MPCHSNYQETDPIESGLTVIFNIVDELNGKYERYLHPHPKLKTVEVSKTLLDEETKKLCAYFQQPKDIKQYSSNAQRWWLNHQIVDFKRLISEQEKPTNWTGYEQGLMDSKQFLNAIVDDAFQIIQSRFDKFTTKEESAYWQKSITVTNFVQAFSTFELFCELMYLKLTGKEITDPAIFKNFKRSQSTWWKLLGKSYNNWLSPQDLFELERYYEKYSNTIFRKLKARSRFEATPTKQAIESKMVFTINDSTNAMRILTFVKSKIIDLSNTL